MNRQLTWGDIVRRHRLIAPDVCSPHVWHVMGNTRQEYVTRLGIAFFSSGYGEGKFTKKGRRPIQTLLSQIPADARNENKEKRRKEE